MKIAFWSHQRGTCGVTANLACMSILTAITGMGKSVLLENHYSVHSLENLLMSPERVTVLKEKGEYYNKIGLEYLIKHLCAGESSDSLVRRASLPLLYSSIYFLPQSYIVNREVFNYEFEMVREELFTCLDAFSDTIFIDTESNGNLSSVSILQEADLIVVNLNQNPKSLAAFFENYSSILDKCVFLVGKYQPEYSMNMRKICRDYEIPRGKIGVVPYNMEFEEAMSQGRTLQYLNRNYQHADGKENAYFMKECKRSSMMLQNYCRRLGKTKQNCH